MPFLTEEIWHALHGVLALPLPAKSIALTRYPLASDFPADPTAEAEMAFLQELIVAIRAVRKKSACPKRKLPPSASRQPTPPSPPSPRPTPTCSPAWLASPPSNPRKPYRLRHQVRRAL